MTAGRVDVQRAYDQVASREGMRILVDRLWPRGLSKEKAHLDGWCKRVAPSTELRKWYNHDPERFLEFARRYQVELQEPERAEALSHLRALARQGDITLITASRRSDISEATVLADLLNDETAS